MKSSFQTSRIGASERDVNRNCRGQSMVEFSVICFFGILVVIQGMNVIEDVSEAIRDNYRRYSLIVSLSEYPDEYGSTVSNTGLVDLDIFVEIAGILGGGVPDDTPGKEPPDTGLPDPRDPIRNIGNPPLF